MRIASISLVKNEADIIESFVRHNMHFVDRMYVIDDGSIDHTSEILRRLASELDLVVLPDGQSTGPFYQAQRTNDAIRTILRDSGWDLIVPLDADEFICATSRQALESSIEQLPAGFAGTFSEIRYFFTADDDVTIADPLRRIRKAFAFAPDHPFKTAVPAALMKDDTVGFVEGNHFLLKAGVRIPSQPIAGIPLAHFSVRSGDQIAIKCLKHYFGWQRRADYFEGMTPHLIQGTRALKGEPRFAVSDQSEILPAYLGFDPRTSGIDRPFVERRGEQKWPELAKSPPFGQLIDLLDQTFDWARRAEIKRLKLEEAAGGSDQLQAVLLECERLRRELDQLNGSRSALTKAYWKNMRAQIVRSARKRFPGFHR